MEPDNAEETSASETENDSEFGVTRKDQATLARLAGAKIKAVTPLSPRTLSVLLRLENGEKAVFKPILRGDKRPLHEVAAFRLSRWLGLEMVPAATMRSLPFEFVAARLDKEDATFAARFRKRRPNATGGKIEGAIIEWLPGLDPSVYRALGGKEGLLELVRLGSAPQPLAEPVCAMLLFDYLIGNWDRFSGGNVFVSEDGQLALIDHNSSFEPWSNRQAIRMTGLLRSVEKGGEAFYRRLEQLDSATLAHIVTERSDRGPVLTKDEIEVTMERKAAILEHLAKAREVAISQTVE